VLHGETPPEGQRWRSTFQFTGFTPRPDIPIYLAGLSPAMLRLAGEIADGVLLWACPASYVSDVVIPEITRGRQRVGKDLTGFAVMPAVPSAAGGDPGVVLDGVRRELHRYFGLPFYRAMFTAAGYGSDVAAYDAAAPDPEAQRRAITEDFIENLCAIGADDGVRAGIQRFRDAGATNPIITAVWGTDFTATMHAAATTRRPVGE
jgi:alkanesulfonate monooxygenase SsuD/methylene tetrahydromethanopterin reductase-like flavin-dependent oxidoreductase (luciferase family)